MNKSALLTKQNNIISLISDTLRHLLYDFDWLYIANRAFAFTFFTICFTIKYLLWRILKLISIKMFQGAFNILHYNNLFLLTLLPCILLPLGPRELKIWWIFENLDIWYLIFGYFGYLKIWFGIWYFFFFI